MKNFSFTGMILLVLFLVSGAHAQFLNGPESVTYDELNGRYLISNVLTGDIVQISDAGDTTFFDRSLARTLGMAIVGSILYVADISGLVTFDLKIDQKITTITLPGMIELNDVTADTSGYLYITDIGAGKIFRVRINDHFYTTLVSGITKPNGIIFDAQNNRVLFCQFVPNAPITKIDLNDSSVTTVLSTSFANFDGLAIDGDGYIYVSCWGTNSVYRYDNAFSLPAELVSNGHSGPADIFYNQQDNVLAIPNYYSSVVDFVPITPADIDTVYDRMPIAIALSQNYPNPFNPITTINFHITERLFTSLYVFNQLGEKISTLIEKELESGNYEVNFDASNLPSGVYFYRISSGSFIDAKKMLFIK